MNKWGDLFHMGKAPAFQFYANDFMDATRFMEANAVGLFIRCLCIQWTQGALPSNLRSLSKGVGMDFEEFEKAWPPIASKFVKREDGQLINRRLEAVRSRQEEISSKRSNAGKSGVLAKANASANGPTKAKQRKVKEKEKVEREVEGEGEGSERAHEPEVIPAGMSVDMFHAIKRWEQYRKEKRNALTPSGREAFVKKCKAWGDTRAIAAIDHSIAQGWTGCFEPQQNGTGQGVDRDERKRLVLEAVAEHHRNKRSDG